MTRASYDALFLLNVCPAPGIPDGLFLEAGKPVFIFLGDRVIPEEYNRIPLFPWTTGRGEGGGDSKPARIAQADYDREGPETFLRVKGESLKGASFRRYFKIEGARRTSLTLENEDPLLVQAELGKGTLFFFASSADLDWNDLPLKAAYLPLIQGLLKEAVGLTAGFPSGSVSGSGNPLRRSPPPFKSPGLKGGRGYINSFPSRAS